MESTQMINFVCVYRTGKIYFPEYIARLAESIATFYPKEHTFTTLTDVPLEIPFIDTEHQDARVVRLDHLWPIYWPKIELFRPDLFPFGSPVVYFDLDTGIRRSLLFLDRIMAHQSFFMLRDWLEPNHCNSSVMKFTAGVHSHIYHHFLSQPDGWMKSYKTYPARWGDQSFIYDQLQALSTPVSRLQDEFPGGFVSFKANTTDEKVAASVVCFHGNPRPHAINWSYTAPFGGR